MKLLVMSDSHGNIANMRQAVQRESPDRILHLGDYWRDAERLRECYPEVPMDQVPGNCDFRSAEEPEQLLVIQQKRILICHGHTYQVKQSLLRAGLAAEEADLDAFLFGHTHRAFCDYHGKTLMFNPGSIGEPRGFYGILTLENGKLDGRIYTLG